jgi:glycosyltransferase involved in cell wall biosynthesis
MGWFPDDAGGLNRYVRDLFAMLSEMGADPRAVIVGPATCPPAGVSVVSDRMKPVARRLGPYSRAAAASSQQVSVVDAHFALYALAPVFGALRRLPLVVHFQGPWAQESAVSGMDGPWSLLAKRRIEGAVYRRARECVVLSNAFRRLLIERYQVSPWHVHTIPPGVDLARFSPGLGLDARAALGIPEGTWVCLSVRRLVARMGLDVLLEAWASISCGAPDGLLLAIGGEGPELGALERRAHALGVSGSVRFLGGLSEADLVSWYRAADVCVVPSLALEGYGLVVLEALACGTPVIAADVGGLPEAVAGLQEDLIVPPGDPAALAARLQSALDGRRPLPSSGSCRRHAEGFSLDTSAARNLEVYRLAANPTQDSGPKVVYLDHFAGLSGGELALARLLPSLSGVVPHVILAEEGPLAGRLLRQGISVEVLPLAEHARSLRRDRVRPRGAPLHSVVSAALYALRLARRLRRIRPDLVHTNSLKSALYGGLAGRLAGVPVIWHVRDRIAEDYLPRPAVRLVRAVARIVPVGVIANSEATLATLPPLPGRSWVIPSPIARPEEVPRARRPDGSVRIGMLGRLAPWKGQEVFLDAFAQARGQVRTGQDLHAVIIGAALFGEEGYEASLHKRVAALGLESHVEFLGFVDDVVGALGGLDVLVHASIIPEPFGQVVVQAMAAGLPVVAAGAGGPAEVVEHGIDGLLYPPADRCALAAHLVCLAEDRALRQRLGQAGRVKARRFTPEALAPAVAEVYEQVLHRKGKP